MQLEPHLPKPTLQLQQRWVWIPQSYAPNYELKSDNFGMIFKNHVKIMIFIRVGRVPNLSKILIPYESCYAQK